MSAYIADSKFIAQLGWDGSLELMQKLNSGSLLHARSVGQNTDFTLGIGDGQ
jgi:hypothetical protein